MGRPIKEEGVILDDVEHGKKSSYNKGCRCLTCRKANANATRALNQRKKDLKAASSE